MIDLKKIRLDKGLNQVEFASLIDFSVRTVQHWERQERSMSLDNFKQIADKLGISVFDILKKYGIGLETDSELSESTEDLLITMNYKINYLYKMFTKMNAMEKIAEFEKTINQMEKKLNS